jgi:hypothetical protein
VTRLSGPALHTAEDASPGELKAASVRLLTSLLALALLVVLLLRNLPLGETTRTGILAWLLVAAALYWLYAGQGLRPLLLLQLLLFSLSAVLLTAKAALVGIGVHRLSILRRTALGLIVAGSGFALANLVVMVGTLISRWRGLEKTL